MCVQVLSAVVARADALKASGQAHENHDVTIAANATSPPTPALVKTEVVKGHYLNRMIKDNQLPMELIEGEG